MIKKISIILLAVLITSTSVFTQNDDDEKEEDKSPYKSLTFNGFKFRLLGPAITSGRVTDFAVNPDNYHEFYVSVASGNVWKTKQRFRIRVRTQQ